METAPWVIRNERLLVWTEGLRALGGRDILLRVEEPSDVTDAEELLRYLVNYCTSQNLRFEPGETVSYGYWQLRLELGDDGLLRNLQS